MIQTQIPSQAAITTEDTTALDNMGAPRMPAQPWSENVGISPGIIILVERFSRCVFRAIVAVLVLVNHASSARSQDPDDEPSATIESHNTQDPDDGDDASTGKPSNDDSTVGGPESGGKGIQFFAPRSLDMQFGMRFQANDNYCTDMLATIAFPTEWPEQRVTVKQSWIPGNAAWQFRDLPANAPPTARQLVMSIPGMQPGGELDIIFEVEIEKSFINPPADTTIFVIPKKLKKELNWYMGNSPMIDANASDIKRVAKNIVASSPPDAWSHVERIYDWVRTNIEYRNGPIRNTREAMKDKKGDCEEMTGIFIAICRASGIPARCVWIPEHCYPEFYLEDDEGKGHWFPCQVAGDRQFGQMHDYRPILQKGDRFKVPEKNAMQHYVSEYFTCRQRAAGPREPSVEPVLDMGPLKQEIEALQAEAARSGRVPN